MKTGPEDFWAFFALREDARRRRELKDGPPYSRDPIIAKYHFCNVYRECDSGTRYFQQFRARPRNWRTRGEDGLWPAGLRAVLWQAAIYRPINRVETFEAFRRDLAYSSPFVEPGLGSSSWLPWLAARFRSEARVFTGRHLNRGMKAYRETVRFLERKGGVELECVAHEIELSSGLEGVVKALRRVPGIGPFFGWQIACDLVESCVVADDPAWAQLGPGAIRGARLVGRDEGLSPAACLDTAKWLVETQRRGISITLDPLSWFRFPVTLKDVEHALCEYARYVQARDGNPTLEVKPWAR